MKNNLKLLGATIAIGGLVACGGGGGDAPAPIPKAEGVYVGTLSGSTSRDFQLLVLENDEYWAMYGTNIGTRFAVAGFVQGQGASNNGSFTSSDLRDFGATPASAGTLSASYSAANKSISGSVLINNQSGTFTGAAPTNPTYDYNAQAALSSITGAWPMSTLANGVAV